MLGRKTFTREELDGARAAVAAELAAYASVARAAASAGDARVASALADLEPRLFGELVLALDRRFVHRVRAVADKDGNALNEVELLAESLMDNGGVLRGSTVIRYVPEASVLGLRIGEPIVLGAAQYERLAGAFLDEIEARFL